LNSINYQTVSGVNKSISPNIQGSPYTFTKAFADISLKDQPTITRTTGQNGSTTAMTATFTFNVQAVGGDVAKLTVGSVLMSAYIPGTNVSINAVTGTPVTIPNTDIAEGSIAQVTVTGTIYPNIVPRSGLYTFAIKQINWVIGGVSSTQTTGLQNFVTPKALFFEK
jgi:hypothetical protein